MATSILISPISAFLETVDGEHASLCVVWCDELLRHSCQDSDKSFKLKVLAIGGYFPYSMSAIVEAGSYLSDHQTTFCNSLTKGKVAM